MYGKKNMYCENCGKKLDDGDLFCSQCGAKRPDAPMEAVAEPEKEAEGNEKQSRIESEEAGKKPVPLILAVIFSVCIVVAGAYTGFRLAGIDRHAAESGAGKKAHKETVLTENCMMEVSQYDISDYPTVKLYLEVLGDNGAFVEGLTQENFRVAERRGAEGESKERDVKKIVNLNENEGISIGMIADASGSMEADIGQVKSEILAFLDTVQFEKGDEVELVKFSDESYICASFTNDLENITEAVQTMTTEGNTRLYDTLMNEIERIQSQQNVKCIIAFTDGMDNESIYTADEVSAYAAECQIPVFLIGIGPECDEGTLTQLAEETGGSYQNIDDIALLEDNYRSIYQKEKEIYLMEYEVEDADDLERGCSIAISLQEESGETVDEAEISFEPMDFFEMMYNRFLIAGIDCQTKGERNLLDSGLIVTTQEAYENSDCVAYQSQEAINSKGTGASGSNVYVVLMDHEVLNVIRNGDGSYTVYGVSNYDINKINRYGELISEQEKQAVFSIYGESSREKAEYMIEENRSNYEKLTLVKDTDGKWKFFTRVYEREDGGNPYPINEIYNVSLY